MPEMKGKTTGRGSGCFQRASLLFCFLLIFSGLLCLSGCEIKLGGKKKKKNNDTEESLAPVVIRPSWTGDISTYLRLNGVLEADREVEVFSRTMGRIENLTVEEGDRVKSGQILARLENDEQQLALERAQAALESNQAALRRAEELFSRQMIAEDEIERLRLSVRDAELQLKQAELSLKYTIISAPFSGIIAERYVSLGDRVNVSRPLFKLVDNRILRVDGWVAQKDIAKLEIGQEASITTTASSVHNYIARLVRISPVVDPTFGKVKVTFELPGRGVKLKPGQFVELELVLETHHDVQQMVKKALVYEAGIPVVFLAKDSLAFRRRVELGLETGDLVEIISGIDPGDSVIVEGQATLRDSARIKIVTPAR